MYAHVLMRDEKEGRKKQTNKQGKATQYNQHIHVLYMYMLLGYHRVLQAPEYTIQRKC